MARLYGPGPEPPPPLIATRDLGGLPTNDAEGRPIGELVGTLSEQGSGLIRYVDVAIRDAGRHVLVPIGHARMDRAAVPPRFRLRAATRADLLSIPPFEGDVAAVDGPYHGEVMAAHGRLFRGSRYYAHPAYDHSVLAAGAPSETAGGTEPPEDSTLQSLAGGGLRIAPAVSGLIGRAVRDRAGETVGEVRDLLVDRSEQRVRYAVIGLRELGRSTALPVGYLEPNPDAGPARMPALSREDVRLLPAYDPPLSREMENRIHAALEGRLTGGRYFDRPDFRSGPDIRQDSPSGPSGARAD